MRYEDLSLRVRERGPWEALDLGVSMTRCWWRDVYAAWFAITLPLFIVINVVLSDHPGWAMMLVWWLKPLYDRVLLQVYSQAVFGQRGSLREVLAALPSLLAGSGLLLHLSLYRLDPTRSFRLPVWQLEGLRGKARRARYRVLAARAGSYAWWLMFAGMHLEFFLLLSVFGLVWLFTPSMILEAVWQQGWNFMSDSDWQRWVYLAMNAIQYLAMSAIEPLYVVGGFSLYLNRRTQLEGWDLEISFRRLAERLRHLGSGAARGVAQVALLLAGGLLVLGLSASPTLMAAETTEVDAAAAPLPIPASPLAAAESGRVIEQVLADKDFGGTRAVQRWRLKQRSREKKNLKSDNDLPSIDWGWLPALLERLIWVAFGLAALLLVYLLVRHRGRWQLPARRKPVAATVVSGMDISPESLPDDVAAVALLLWQQGRFREALGLAYRGALSALVHRYQLALEDSATEGDVLRAAHGRLDAAAEDCLGTLTRLWQTQAYAHRHPDEDAVLDMLAQWRQYFGQAAASPPAPIPPAEGGVCVASRCAPC